MDTAQWTQPIKEMERRNGEVRKEEELKKCPRCNSKNTKFCYYNNYSLSQPRYFCKTCRRYWTHGGSLRTIPVGGASRKNKTSTRSSSSKNNKPFVPSDLLLLPPPTHEEAKAQDLAFSQELQGISSNSSPSDNPHPTFTAFPNASSSSGFGLSYEFIGPALGFSLDDPLSREEDSSGTKSETILFESLKPPSSSSITNSVVEYNHSQKNPDDLLHDKGEEEDADRSAAFWSDLFGGGGDSWHL